MVFPPEACYRASAALTSRQPWSRRWRRGQNHLFGRYVVLEFKRLQPGLELADRVVFRGDPLGKRIALPCRFLELGFDLIKGGVKGMARRSQVFGRAAPAWELGQGGFRFFLGTGEFAASVGEPRIQVAGLASLADRAAEWFDIERSFQVGQLFFLALDLVFMPGDRPPRFFGLTASWANCCPSPRMTNGSSTRGAVASRPHPDRSYAPRSRRTRRAWCSASC